MYSARLQVGGRGEDGRATQAGEIGEGNLADPVISLPIIVYRSPLTYIGEVKLGNQRLEAISNVAGCIWVDDENLHHGRSSHRI